MYNMLEIQGLDFLWDLQYLLVLATEMRGACSAIVSISSSSLFQTGKVCGGEKKKRLKVKEHRAGWERIIKVLGVVSGCFLFYLNQLSHP